MSALGQSGQWQPLARPTFLPHFLPYLVLGSGWMARDSPGQSNEKLFPFWVLTTRKVDEPGSRWTRLRLPPAPPNKSSGARIVDHLGEPSVVNSYFEIVFRMVLKASLQADTRSAKSRCPRTWRCLALVIITQGAYSQFNIAMVLLTCSSGSWWSREISFDYPKYLTSKKNQATQLAT